MTFPMLLSDNSIRAIFRITLFYIRLLKNSVEILMKSIKKEI